MPLVARLRLTIAVTMACAACTTHAPANRKQDPANSLPAPSSAAQAAAPANSSGDDANAPPQADAGTEDTEADAGPQPRLVDLGFAITRKHPEKRFEWRLFEQLNWQASAEQLPALPPASAVDSPSCAPGMVLIEGRSLVDSHGRDDTDEVMYSQNLACTTWLTQDRGVNALCDRFDRQRWQAIAATLPRRAMRFCMDRYEFPNAYGEFPLVVVRFAEAETYCAKVGKRVCTENEWTFACEGEEGLPFLNGYVCDPSMCNIGILGPSPDTDTFKPRTLERTARGLDIAWQGRRSGESPRCKSPFGVEDMIGNVDEWTRSVRPYGYKMIFKGGHWGPGRHRCRPQTRGHGPQYVRYDQGFRCCRDAQDAPGL